MRAVVTGASGYVGGRLVPALLARGHEVKVLVRSPEKLEGVAWKDDVEVLEGDVTDASAVEEAARGADTFYFLVHSMGAGKGFAKKDREVAWTVRDALERAGAGRLVYLGGLGDEHDDLSEHLASRAEVARILASGRTPSTVLRAGVVIGSGSASFEMLRNLTERLPVMVVPNWVGVKTQPVSVRDAIHLLVRAGEEASHDDLVLDVGGPDVMSFLDMMKTYAAVAELPQRRIKKVKLMTPELSSHWIGVVTPVPTGVARPLVGSLKNESVCTGELASERYGSPEGGLLSYEEAVRRALGDVRTGEVPTRWSDARWASERWRDAPHASMEQDPPWAGGVLCDRRSTHVEASRAQVWAAVEAIGGETGWHSSPWAWQTRGALDLVVGGASVRRGRRDPRRLRVGDALDAWRVEEREEGTLLRLRAEMRIPGRGWLEWHVEEGADGVELTQKATFAPKGLSGWLYWRSLAVIHPLVFTSMLRGLKEAAEGQREADRQA
jgi:uncharacterized protein YbjT (DUF2867 family)